MGDDITIGVTEIVNNIEVTAQPNDQIVELSVVDNADDVTLNITPTVIEINVNKGSSYAKWGTILGTLSDQEDLQDALDLKADLVDGKVPSSQLPSYVDDVIEVADYESLPTTGESGKIYITLDDNHIYRWTGSTYVEITDNTSVWGAITGTLSSQTDLQSALNAKALKTTTISTNSPLSGGGDLSANRTLSISQASASVDGYLSSTDWNTFNSKLSSLSGAVLTTTDQNISGVKTFTDLAKFTNGTGSFAIEIDVTTSGALVVKDTGTTKLQIGKNGEILAAKYKINGGFSSQFLKANGDLDSTIYTPASRTLTINGTSYDLSANRSWTIPTHDAVTISTSGAINGLSIDGSQQLSITTASSSSNGALSSTDWTTFNNKLSSLSGAVLTTTNQNIGGIKTFTDLTDFSASGIRIGLQGWVTPNQVYSEGTGNFYVNLSGAGHTIIGNSGKNVGIGITSPAAKLSVSGNIESRTTTSASTTNYIRIGTYDVNGAWGSFIRTDSNYSGSLDTNLILGTSSGGSPLNALTILSGGNVGIGTTSPSDKLDLYGAIRLTRTDDTAQYSTIQSNSNGSFIVTSYRPYAGAGNYGDFRFEGKDSTGATATQLYINTNGRVGIGTQTDAGFRLDVNGTGRFSGSLTASGILSTSTNHFYNANELRLYNSNNTNWGVIKGSSSTSLGDISILGGSGNGIFVASGGNVGIGTPSPGYKLDLLFSNTTDADIFRAGMSGVSNGFEIRRVSSNFRYLFNDGNVGIGTTSPGALLHLNAGASNDTNLRVQSGAAGNHAKLTFSNSSNTVFWTAGYRSGTGDFGINYGDSFNSTGLTINTSGNVGIGTTSPSSGISSTETTLQIQNYNVAALSLNNSSSRKYTIYSGVGGQLGFYDVTRSIECMTLDLNGRLGIGTTSPSAPLAIGRVNTSNEGGQIDLCRSSDNASAWGIDVYGSSSNPSLRFIDNVASATRMTLKPNGIINMDAMPYYTNNAAALAGGLTYGDLYYDDNATVKIVINLG